MIYHAITDNIDYEKKLSVDEILGSKSAKAERVERRRSTVSTAGFEVG